MGVGDERVVAQQCGDLRDPVRLRVQRVDVKRVAFLTDYQNAAYAQSYQVFVTIELLGTEPYSFYKINWAPSLRPERLSGNVTTPKAIQRR